MDILNNFGVKPILLVAQAVNFFILLFLLKRFLYKPILKMLDSRKAIIVKSLEDAKKIEERLAKIEAEKDQIFQKASQEGKKLIEEAANLASSIVSEAHSKAAKDGERIILNARKTLEQESDNLHQEIRVELANMVAQGLKNITGKVLTEKEKKEILEKSIKDIK